MLLIQRANSGKIKMDEQTLVRLGRYIRTLAERGLDKKFRRDWRLENYRDIITLGLEPREALRELFPFYQIVDYRGIPLRNREFGVYSRQRNNGLILLPREYGDKITATTENIPKGQIVSAARRPTRRTYEILSKEAKEIIRVLSERHPMKDQNKKLLMQRLTALEEARYALAPYLETRI